MYIKYNKTLRSHNGTMLNGASGGIDSDYYSLANSLDLDPCNIASFSNQISTNRNRTTKYHTVLENAECVVLAVDAGSDLYNPLGLVFRASDIKKYLMKTTTSGKSVVLQNYISTVIPYTLGDAGNANYINTVSNYWFNPSTVAILEAGESNNLPSYVGADSNSLPYDWYDVTIATEDYVVFPLYIDVDTYIDITTQHTFDFGFITTDMANTDGIYNVSDVIRINEF